MLRIKPIRFHCGLQKPVRILHLTDVHITLADEQDSDAEKQFAERRTEVFQDASSVPETPSQLLEEAMEYAKQFDCTVITGDVIDNFCHANLEETRRILSGKDYMFALGNHEYIQVSRLPSRTHESLEAKAECMDVLRTVFPGDLTFDSRIVGGVNVITADNALLAWSGEQYDRFRQEAAKGYPMLIFTHVPLILPEGQRIDQLEGHMLRYGYTQEDIALTREVNDYLIDEPLVKGFIAGHCHMNADCEYRGKPCYLIGGLFDAIAAEIVID